MMNLITAKKVKPIIIVLIILIIAIMLISGGIVTAIVLHQNSVHKLSEKMRDEGPWNPEPSIWASKITTHSSFAIIRMQIGSAR